ncbi:MAG TPA: methyl-accepting chemotaxis protein [Bacteroidales bacterium]|nr:methyl-accepting chemotaxis protein [Bacteroidales bacterium]
MRKLIKDIKISHGIIFITVLAISFIVGLSANSLYNFRKSRNFISELKNERIEPTIELFKIIDAYGITIVDVSNKVIHGTMGWEEGSIKIRKTRGEIKERWAHFSLHITSEDIKSQVVKIDGLMQKTDLILERLNNVLQTHNQANLENIVVNEMYASIEPLNQAIREIVHLQEAFIAQISQESENLYAASSLKIIHIGITTVLLLIGLTAFITLTIAKSLKKATASIKKIAAGDLSVEITDYGKDEIGSLMHNIKSLVDNLRPVIETIIVAASNIAQTSQEMSKNSQEISQGAAEQAASVEQMAASMEEISANIIQTAKNAKLTEQISVLAGKEFENGRENIDTTVVSMQSIASKISIIDEIAFQTNILALNAAVEAARAGEHGKGFGVVAAEVGKLAERSKTAAAEIEAISKSGVDLSLKSKDLLEIALPNINKTIKLVKEISVTSSDQSIGVDQINSGIQTLNHVTQQNAAASEEMATVAEELAAQADQLSNSIRFFSISKDKKPKEQKKPEQKFLKPKTYSKPAKPAKQRGIHLDLNTKDYLDDEFETF